MQSFPVSKYCYSRRWHVECIHNRSKWHAVWTRMFFYCFLGDACMTGRGFRDESCSRGLSDSQSGKCPLSLRHCIKEKVLNNNDNNNTPPCLHLRLYSTTNSYSPLGSNQDVSNNTFLNLTVEPSIFYYCLLWKMIISLQNISIYLYLYVYVYMSWFCGVCVCVCRFNLTYASADSDLSLLCGCVVWEFFKAFFFFFFLKLCHVLKNDIH